MNPNLKLNMRLTTRLSYDYDADRNMSQYDHVLTVEGREIIIPWREGYALENDGLTSTWYVPRAFDVIFKKGKSLPSPGDTMIFVATDLKTFLMRNRGQNEWSYIETFVPYVVISRAHCPKHGYRFLLTMICAIELPDTNAARYVEILI